MSESLVVSPESIKYKNNKDRDWFVEGGDCADKTAGIKLLNPLLAIRGKVEAAAGFTDATPAGGPDFSAVAWVDPALTALDAVGDLVAVALDPIAAVASSMAGFLMEHIQPLRDALDFFTGSPWAIAAASGTWANCAEELGKIHEEIGRLRDRLAAMSGAFIDATQSALQQRLDWIAAQTDHMAKISYYLSVIQMLVELVQKFIKDCIADVIGAAVSAAIVEACSLGTATPFVVAKVAYAVADKTEKIGSKMLAMSRTLAKAYEILKQVSVWVEKLDPNKLKLILSEKARPVGAAAVRAVKKTRSHPKYLEAGKGRADAIDFAIGHIEKVKHPGEPLDRGVSIGLVSMRERAKSLPQTCEVDIIPLPKGGWRMDYSHPTLGPERMIYDAKSRAIHIIRNPKEVDLGEPAKGYIKKMHTRTSNKQLDRMLGSDE